MTLKLISGETFCVQIGKIVTWVSGIYMVEEHWSLVWLNGFYEIYIYICL